jgi:atypical dual specificity phosphatase
MKLDSSQCIPVTHHFQPETESYLKQAKYQISLVFTLAKNYFDSASYAWWNRIHETNIILGAVPLENKGHHDQIALQSLKNGKFAVLTLLEPFEIYTKGMFSTPVPPTTWKALGAEQKIIPAEDFNPLTQDQIKEAVEFLKKQDDAGVTTYVHCKAGRGRSATAVVCFLMQKFGLTAENAKEKVRVSRPQINLNSYQWQAIKIYEASLKV